MLTLARVFAMRERGADRDRGIHAGDDVGDRHARALRPAARGVVRLAGDAHHSAHPLNHEIVARMFAVRAGVAEAGDGAVDEPRIELTQLRIAEPIAPEVAVLVVLN